MAKQEKPVQKQLPLDDLIIESYMRAGDERRMQQLANTWDWKLYQDLTVVHHEGLYYLIDGQHRRGAAMLKALTSLPCQVHEGFTFEVRAMMFVELQRRRRGLKPIEVYVARIDAKDSDALAVAEILAKHDLDFARTASSNRIASVATVFEAWKNPETGWRLDDALRRMLSHWYGLPQVWQSDLILAMSQIVEELTGRDDSAQALAELDETMGHWTPEIVLLQAQQMHIKEIQSGAQRANRGGRSMTGFIRRVILAEIDRKPRGRADVDS
jgi:hypothetical protein